MTSHARIYDLILKYIPHLESRPHYAVEACTMIKEWLDAGADPDLDVIPAINRHWAKTPNGARITSPRYFDVPVRTAHHVRVTSAEAKAKEAAVRAKAIKFKRDRAGMYVPTYELAELERYEAEHGPIAL